ncbi:MAG: hypothetical protein ABR906_02840 [Terracidiphilus sp.]|jgi:hypothetical protein
MWAWLNLKGQDIVAFVISGLLGFFAAFYITNLWVAIFTSILVSYHLFLAWLIIDSDRKAGFSMPIASTILTHLACMVLVVVLGLGRHIPFFGFLRYGIAGLAIFERGWLFSGSTKLHENRPIADPITTTVAAATANDHEEWLHFVAQQRRPFPRPGTTLQSEYERWMAARARN